MQTCLKSLDDYARSSRLRIAINTFASTNPLRQGGGDEIVGDEAGMTLEKWKFHFQTPGSFTVSRRRRIIVSTFAPSASAR